MKRHVEVGNVEVSGSGRQCKVATGQVRRKGGEKERVMRGWRGEEMRLDGIDEDWSKENRT